MDAIETLLATGEAYYDEGGCLIGIASDGMHVALGFIDRAETLAYLSEHPTPDTW